MSEVRIATCKLDFLSHNVTQSRPVLKAEFLN